MEKPQVRVAELVIADDPTSTAAAIADVVADRAAAAGHTFATRAVVKNDEAAIRAQLVAWIGDSSIDVVVATSAEGIGKALSVAAELGTADELSASAEPTDVQLVACRSTLVFIVPGSASAVADAMDDVIAPHLAASAETEADMAEESEVAPAVPRRARTQPPPLPGDKRSTTPPPSPVSPSITSIEPQRAMSSGVPVLKSGDEQIVSTSEIVAITEAASSQLDPNRTRPTKPPPGSHLPTQVPATEDLIAPVQRTTARRNRSWIAVALLAGAGAIGFGAQRLIEPPQHPKPAMPIASAQNQPAALPNPSDASTAEEDAEIPEVVIDVSTPPRPNAPAPVVAAAPAPIHRDKAEANPTVGDGCSEAMCVSDNYAAECCARYKPGSDAVPNGLAKWMVKAAIDRLKPRVIACGEKFAAKGTVRIAVTVAPDGSVTAADVAEASNPGLGSCVAEVLRSGKFAKTASGGSFRYPFVF